MKDYFQNSLILVISLLIGCMLALCFDENSEYARLTETIYEEHRKGNLEKSLEAAERRLEITTGPLWTMDQYSNALQAVGFVRAAQTQ